MKGSEELLSVLIDAPIESESQVRAVNDYTDARYLLCSKYQERARDIDYTRIPHKELWEAVCFGQNVYKLIAGYYPGGKIAFPKTPLPSAFLVEQVFAIDPDHPYTLYRKYLAWVFIYLQSRMVFQNRVYEHPEILDLMAIAPDMSTKDNPQYFQRIMTHFDLTFNSKNYDKFVDNVLSVSEKPEQLIKAGLDGKLDRYINKAIKNDKIDDRRKPEPPTKTESEKDAIRREHSEDGEITPFLDTLKAPYEEIFPMRIEELNLNLSELNPYERVILQEFIDAYNADIKLPQFWGDDYEAKRKAFQRLRHKLKKI